MTRGTHIRNVFLAGLGWACLLLFVAALLLGHGKTAIDYARRSLKPLPIGQPLVYADRDHASWSGWQMPSADGYRLTNAANPDIVFRAAAKARGCDVILAVFPLLVGNERFQRMRVALNGVEAAELAIVNGEGKFRVANVGGLIDGINVLSLRLPNAGRARPTDEHVLALGLRSVEFVCPQAP
jgi:hypothetical protein